MRALAFWKAVAVDDANLLESFLQLLEQEAVRYCLIGGQAVNAYVEPLVSLDLDVVVAAADLGRLERALAHRFDIERFPHSLNVSASGSDLRIQLHLDSGYTSFVDGAETRTILGQRMRVASLPDVLQGKLWAASDPMRRNRKRQKDLADISRMVERYPELRARVPTELLDRLL